MCRVLTHRPVALWSATAAETSPSHRAQGNEARHGAHSSGARCTVDIDTVIAHRELASIQGPLRTDMTGLQEWAFTRS